MSAHKSFVLFVVLVGALVPGCGSSTDPLPRLSSDAVILAFGDSLTFGSGAKAHQSYPTVLQELSGRTVVNAGKPGEVSADGLRRLPHEVEAQAPDLVILCHGGNDILRRLDRSKTQQNLRAMIDYLREAKIPVILVGVPDFGLFLTTADLYVELAEDMDVLIEAGIISELLGDNRFKSDHIHPNAAGYERLAKAIQALLEQNGAL